MTKVRPISSSISQRRAPSPLDQPSTGDLTQLEYGTKLVPGQGYWETTLFRDAGEAVVVFHSARHARGSGGDTDPEEAKRVAARRARTSIRRYCAANRLTRLGTLTYDGGGCHDALALRRDIARFFRQLRRRLAVTALPYLWTAEWHKTDHGLHAHFAVGQFVRRSLIEDAWPRGFVHIKLLGNLSYSATSLEQARVAARYLAKYVAKSLDGQAHGLHRYEVAQGFAPRSESIRSATADEGHTWAMRVMGRKPTYISQWRDWREYQGPPAEFVSWT